MFLRLLLFLHVLAFFAFVGLYQYYSYPLVTFFSHMGWFSFGMIFVLIAVYGWDRFV